MERTRVMRAHFTLATLGIAVALISIPRGSSAAGGGPAPSAGSATASAAGAGATAAASGSGGGGSGGSAAGPTNATVISPMNRHTVFVLVYASDPITATFLAYEVTTNLGPLMREDPRDKGRPRWLLPEPAWTIADYATQCQHDPNTTGAFILYDVENDAGSFNFFLVQNTYAHLYAKVLYLGCEPFSPPFVPGVSGLTTYSQQAQFNGSTVPAMPAPSGTPTPSPINAPLPTTHQVQNTSNFSSPSPTPAPQQPFRSSQQITDVSPPSSQVTQTETLTATPRLPVIWANNSEIQSGRYAANQYGIPFLSVVAAGAYLTARTYTQTTSSTTTVPTTPGGTTQNGSVATTTQKQGNNSALPNGIAYLGFSLTQLSNITLGGANQTRVLKSAAASVASSLRKDLKHECPTQQVAVPSPPTSVCDLFSVDRL
jgi:hypothetical protein